MKRSEYGKAASLVHQHYCEVLDELTEEILETENADPVLGKDIDKVLESYSQQLWYITACLEQLRHASAKPQPAQVATIGCTRDSVVVFLTHWLKENADAAIVSISILENDAELTCIIVFRPGC